VQVEKIVVEKEEGGKEEQAPALAGGFLTVHRAPLKGGGRKRGKGRGREGKEEREKKKLRGCKIYIYLS